ncbi:hypothetical protein [Actinoallomurus sp. NPDC050550]|uniref:DUF7660 family protein n=1 Tax=Actinoallomurus sp. NPDC050550 TaxID=3154937 RepID=UPI0033E187C2
MSSGYETGRFAHVTDIDQVATAVDVQRVLSDMCADLQDHPDEWENPTLDRYLDALAASVEALEGSHSGGRQPTWKLVGELLVKASGYE